MIQLLASWIPQRLLRVLGDSEYAGQSISRHLPANAKLISRMNMKAALYEPAGKTAKQGRPARKATACPVPYSWRKTRKRNGPRPRSRFTESRSSSGTKNAHAGRDEFDIALHWSWRSCASSGPGLSCGSDQEIVPADGCPSNRYCPEPQ